MKSRHRAHGRATASVFGRRVPVVGARDIAVKLVDWALDPTFLAVGFVFAYFAAVILVGPHAAP